MQRDRLKLLLVCTRMDIGGAERFASTLLTHLNRDRLQPQLVLLRDEIGFHVPEDIAVEHLGHRGPWDMLRTVRRLRKRIQDSRPDVVLSNITATNIVTGFALRRIHDPPSWVARIGNSPSRHDSILRRWATAWTYPRADLLVANSQGLANELTQRFPRLHGRIHAMGNPADFSEIDRLSQLTPDRQRCGEHPLLIAVGRLFAQKRYDVLLAAMQKVLQRMEATLWICGDGPLRGRLSQTIQRLGLERHVTLLGFCRNPFALMAQADLFVMSSDHEGSPNALIEAQGLGIPAVVTDCPHGPCEIVIDGETGLLARPGDANELAAKILSWLQSPKHQATNRTTIKQLVRQKFSSEVVIPQWENLLRLNAPSDIQADDRGPELTSTMFSRNAGGLE